MSKRKVVIVSAALISVVLISLVFYFTLRTPIIGIIKGAENEIIEIDGITYIVDDLAENGARRRANMPTWQSVRIANCAFFSPTARFGRFGTSFPAKSTPLCS